MAPDDLDDDHVASVPVRPPPSTAPPLLDRGRDVLVAGRRDWRVGVVVLALVSVVAGWLWYRAGASTLPPPAAGADAAPTTAATSAVGGPAPTTDGEAVGTGAGSAAPPPAPPIVVHVAGAVADPGVHPLDAGARVGDALAAAGGPALDADLDRLNLATVLADGQRVDVPRHGDPPERGGVSGVPPPPIGSPAAGGGVVAGGPIDLNRASAADLEALPGVGPSIAAAIVAHREQHGPFLAVEELLEVRGIGEARLAELRPLVVV